MVKSFGNLLTANPTTLDFTSRCTVARKNRVVIEHRNEMIKSLLSLRISDDIKNVEPLFPTTSVSPTGHQFYSRLFS